jgi:polar amino acid transport system substrate-binding protein
MRHAAPWALIVVTLSTGCGAGGGDVPPVAAADLAPTGSIRAALNFANAVLARKDTPDGEPGGIAAELSRELGRRIDRPVRFLAFDSAAAMADAARTGEWDIAFLAADPAREETISFTPAYLELDATYLVPAGSRIRALGEVDAPGVRVAARPRSAYDLFLRRSLKQAQLVYPEGTETDLDLLVTGRADVLSGLRHVLADTASDAPEWRVLEGRFAAMQQAIGTPQGRAAAAAYLREFVEDVKASGLVAKAIAASGAQGVSVAPPATRP